MDIMIVEDEASVRVILKSYFVNEGWKVHLSSDGQDAMKKIQLYKLDLIVLDLMIPGMPGEEVCRNIRRMSNVPLIMITSKARETDMINGLNLGADDYITKPFRAREVIARIHALQRRINIMNNSNRNIISFNRRRFMVNFELEDVFLDGKAANLTATEFRTLSILVRKPGKVFSRHDLSYEVQGYRFIGDGRVMDVHIRNIRKKIEEDPKNPQYIVTKIGSGYKFNFPLDDD